MASTLPSGPHQIQAVCTTIIKITSVLCLWQQWMQDTDLLLLMLATMAQTVIQESSNTLISDRNFYKMNWDCPPRKPLPGFPQAGLLPHCFVGDEAFPLSVDLMRPYPRGQRGIKLAEDKLVFNYRLSHARRIVECAFGILVQRFQVFDRRMYLSDVNATIVTKACTVLHNYLTPPRSTTKTRVH